MGKMNQKIKDISYQTLWRTIWHVRTRHCTDPATALP